MNKETPYLHGILHDYLEDLSARKIVPGGGSASAMSAALGAGLNLMVINYSIKEDIGKEEDKELIVLKTKQEASLKKLKAAIDEDCKVFKDLMKSLSAASEDTRKSYEKAAAVPLEICRECLVSLSVTVSLLDNCNKNLLADVGCAAYLLESAFFAATLNVMVNIKNIEGGDFTQNARSEMERMGRTVNKMTEEVVSRVKTALV